jgi:hypothetical protein
MRSLNYLLILVLSSLTILQGQNFSKEFGKIGKEESDLTSYTPDNSAAAVVLFDIGKSWFSDASDGSFEVIFERSTRIKIFSDAGLKYAEVEIPVYHEGSIYEQVYEIEGNTYNPEGSYMKISTFNAANSHEEKINEFWTVKKFALPDVKVGSIIEYRYKIVSQYMFNLRNWEFQNRIPTIYSEYIVKQIPFYEYVYLLQGRSKFDIQSANVDNGIERRFAGINYKETINKFVMKDIPAFNDEEYITSINDNIIKLDFQLAKINFPNGNTTTIISTWPLMVKDLLKNEDLGKYAKRCEKLATKLYSPDSLMNKTPEEKFNFILNYVKTNFNWNQGNGKYASKSPSALLIDKIGNAADLNLLVIGLLNAAGIESYPLIVSTRDNGKIRADYPYLKFFNYVLIYADLTGKKVLSDATEVMCKNDRIPPRCLNDRGLLIKEGNVEWVGLQTNVLSELNTNIVIDSLLHNSHSSTSVEASEYFALNYRNSYGSDKKKIVEREGQSNFKLDEQSVNILNPGDREKKYNFSFTSNFKADKIANKIYIAPFLDEPLTENPLKQSSRTYPIDMTYPVKRTFTSAFNIPDGYKIDFIPEEAKILNDAFELNYIVKNVDKLITVTFNYTFFKAVYPAKEYMNIKYYFNEIIKKGNQKIVLVQS